MKNWIFIPHFYQPPTQSQNLTELILHSCYLPFLDLLIKHPDVEMTINLSGSLILQLEAIPNHDFFDKIRMLTDSGQIEFLNSTIFHPILPFSKELTITRQTKENEALIERFCKQKPVNGFFPPELAVDKQTVNLLSQNMDFIIVDESSVNPNFDPNLIPEVAIFKFQTSNFKLLVSSRSLTEILRSYPTELRSENLIKFITRQSSTANDQPLVCATDAEVFGHHYSERINLLKELFGSNEFRFIKATTALNSKNHQPPNKNFITASSWQTNSESLHQNVPFPLWKNPANPLQQKYYQLAELAYQALTQIPEGKINSHEHHSAENHFDQGISSCHPYWLSNTPWWHPDMVELGAKNLIKSIRTLPVDLKFKQSAEQFYHNFMLEIWAYHWSGNVEKNYLKFNEQRQEALKQLPVLS